MTNTEEIEKEAKLYGVEVGDVHELNGFIKGAQWMQSVLESRSDRLIKENKEFREVLTRIAEYHDGLDDNIATAQVKRYSQSLVELAKQALKKP